MNVAIIGAGWAGMAAAVALAQAKIPVTVFEAARHLGGRARSVEIEGIELDNGQHVLIGAYRETLRLMRAVGARLPSESGTSALAPSADEILKPKTAGVDHATHHHDPGGAAAMDANMNMPAPEGSKP